MRNAVRLAPHTRGNACGIMGYPSYSHPVSRHAGTREPDHWAIVYSHSAHKSKRAQANYNIRAEQELLGHEDVK